MIDRPFDQVFAMFRDGNQKTKEHLKFAFEKSDGISLWIIGLSIGAIPLLIANISPIKKVLPNLNLFYLVLFLAVSVVSGIIYRILFLYWFMVQNQISDEVDIAFTRVKKMHQKSVLIGNESFEELTFIVQDCTGVDYSNLIPQFYQSAETNKVILYDSLVKYYLKSVEFAIKDNK